MNSIIIYIIAFLEGFTTLSVEIVALRNFTPIIGTNSISTSIILGVILLALSYGYYVGGKLSAKNKNLDKVLIRNLIIASLYYFLISFTFDSIILELILSSTGSYFFTVLITSFLLFFIPVFLASQTIPILSELLKGKHSGEKMGKLLFYSTVGSFVGAVGTSSFFFPLIGVSKTGLLSSIILVFLAFVSSRYLFNKKTSQVVSLVILIFFISVLFSNPTDNKSIIFNKSNAYHNIEIYDNGDKRIFSLNGALSSGINLDTKNSFFPYIKEAVYQVENIKPKNVLIIGAAGFTFPNDISEYEFIENIDVVDVDGSLKDIAEKYFLEKTLSNKITFYPEPSRYFLNNIKYKKYDFILVDAYSGKSIPAQVLTYEFFKKLTDIGDNIYLNIILDTNLKSDFSVNTLSTINKAFKSSYYKDTHNGLFNKTNMLVTSNNNLDYIKNDKYNNYIYTDNKNTIEIDIFKNK